jgi:hypothetical protein
MTSPHTFDREEVMAYLDGELPAPQAASVRAHLERCESCRAFAQELRAVSSSLSEWQVEAAPSVLDVSVRSALDAAPLSGRVDATREPRSPWYAWFALPMVRLAGAAAAVVIVALITWRVAPPPVEPQSSSPAVADVPQAAPAGRLEAAPPPVSPPGAAGPARELQLPQRGQGAGSARQDAVSEVAVGAARGGTTPELARPAPIDAPPLLTSLPATPPPAPPPAAAQPPVSAAQRSTLNAVTLLPGVAQGQTAAKPTQTADARAAGAGAGRAGGGRGSDATMTQRSMNEQVVDGVFAISATRPVEVVLASLPRPVEAHSIEMVIESNTFDAVRPALASILVKQKGTTQTMATRGEAPDPRVLEAQISIPIAGIDAAVTSLRALGRVVRENQTKDNLDTRIDDLVEQIEKAKRDEQELLNVIGRASDPATTEAATQARARASADRTRLEDEGRRAIGRVREVVVTLRIEEGRQAAR